MGIMNRLRNMEKGSVLQYVDVVCTAALLDGALSIIAVPGKTGWQMKVRDVKLVGGGTNFGAGGNRLLDLTDGTTVYTTVPNANLETAPTVSVPLGNAAIPFLTGTINTKTVAGADLVFKYSGGTTDHSTGSITFQVCVEWFPA